MRSILLLDFGEHFVYYISVTYALGKDPMKKEFKKFGLYKKIFLVLLVLVSGFSYRCNRMESLTKEEVARNGFYVSESVDASVRWDDEKLLGGDEPLSEKPDAGGDVSDVLLVQEKISDARGGFGHAAKDQSKAAFDAVIEDRAEIFVHVAGAVNCPGVYSLKEGSRVHEGIDAAGGFTEDANEDYLNLAEQMVDGQKVFVPRVGEDVAPDLDAASGFMPSEDADTSGQRLIDINTADKALLITLPGIGEKRAEDIIAFRNEHGFFRSIEDIKKVPGIKENAFQKMKNRIKV